MNLASWPRDEVKELWCYDCVEIVLSIVVVKECGGTNARASELNSTERL